MTERYQITIRSQMGPRKGFLTLWCEGNAVTGSLELVGYINTLQGIRSEDGMVYLYHPIRTAVSTFPCETVLELKEGHLTGTTATPRAYRMRWEGTRISDSP